MPTLTKVRPFRIISNVYFVGTKEASSHLIDTGDGLILIDTGYAESAPLVEESIRALGFCVSDVKIILHSHGHADHTHATPALLEVAKEAKTYLGREDVRYLCNRFTPDFFYEDGGVISLGNTSITTLFTPGHTEGSYSFFFNVTEDGVTYRAGMFGGAGPRQLRLDYMRRPDRNVSYLNRGRFFDSIERLLKERVDIPLGNHTWHNRTLEKGLEVGKSEKNPFIAEGEWERFLESSKEALLVLMAEDTREHFVNFAHRGAPAYCPENTLLSFYTGLYMGANGIETDIHKTADGTLVLFHDDTLTRVCGVEGRPEDLTCEEFTALRVHGGDLWDHPVTFEDFLIHFADKELTFAIELKGAECEEAVADMIFKYGLERKCTVTSFHFEYIKRIKEYAPTLRIGYLTSRLDDETVQSLIDISADEYCPRGRTLTREWVEKLHRIGFNVRAWGVENEEMMQYLYDIGVDGMTVNFTDKLTEYIKSKKNDN